MQLGESVLDICLRKVKESSLPLEAIYIASPDLHSQLMRFIEKQELKEDALKKLEESLCKYFIRMSTNCTPFGLFAGYTVGHWGESTDIKLKNSEYLERNIRIDMEYACEAAHYLLKDRAIFEKLKYYPNNSIYKVGDDLRFTEYRNHANDIRTHHIVAIKFNDILSLILKKTNTGLFYQEIIDLLMTSGYGPEDATSYINELIANQVLVSEIEPNVTGINFPKRLAKILIERKLTSPFIKRIISIASEIKEIDKSDHPIAVYQDIYTSLTNYEVKISEKRTFQIDCHKEAEQCKLVSTIQKELLDGIDFLLRLNPSCQTALRIRKFRRAFYERYEDRVVPLAEVLDPEIGIGYRKASSIADTYSTPNPYDDPHIEFKFQKYKEAMFSLDGSVVLTEQDKNKLARNDEAIPASIYSDVTVLGNKDSYKILFHYAGGPSGANLSGRFADSNPELETKIIELCRQEENQDPNRIYAEVVHLPQSRQGNVLSRPIFRKYEIPYLALSTLPPNQQILISDLYLFLKNGKLVIYSKSRKKEVIPRLSSAHNFSNGLPVYNFLGDMQYQDIQGDIYWDWGVLKTQSYLPRVQYKNMILSPAMWSLNTHMFRECLNSGSWDTITLFMDEFRRNWKMPARVYFAEGDNHLMLDLTTDFGKKFLLKELKNKKQVRLIEAFCDDSNTVAKDSIEAFTNEFIIPFIRKQTKMPAVLEPGKEVEISASLKRRFIPGSEWLYFKIYTVEESTDKLLICCIHPLIKKLQKKQLIDKWFFLRYADPSDHIRLRLLLHEISYLGEIIGKVYKAILPFSKLNIIQNVQIETYNREIERYGESTMEVSETFFSINSDFTSEVISAIQPAKSVKLFAYISIWGVDSIYKAFNYNEETIISLTKSAIDQYEDSSASSKVIRNDVHRFYRENSKELEMLLSGNFKLLASSSNLNIQLHTLQKIMKKNINRMSSLSSQVNEILNGDKPKLNLLLFSFTHMFLNRLLTNYTIDSEKKVYYFLNKLYKSKKARN
jgi:thiopeptide-type bacteriocin biosynthesis protein